MKEIEYNNKETDSRHPETLTLAPDRDTNQSYGARDLIQSSSVEKRIEDDRNPLQRSRTPGWKIEIYIFYTFFP